MSLFHTLNISSQSLFSTRQGMDTTAHNIANAQTEGYSRQRIHLDSRTPQERHGILIGEGAYVSRIERAHNAHIEQQLSIANMDFGASDARHNALLSLESIYSTDINSSLASELSNFFGALQDLAQNPEELTIRTSVREQAQNLCSSFRRIDLELRRFQDGMNDQIKNEVINCNQLLQGIARLNTQIRVKETGPEMQANDLRDQRELMIRKLSEKIDLNYYEDRDGMLSVHGPDGCMLVDRSRASTFTTAKSELNPEVDDVILLDSEMSGARNLTREIRSGSLAAFIDVRDNIADSLLDHNNAMAKTLITEVNSVHSQGYGLGDFRFNAGRNFFTAIRDDSRAAHEMKLDLSIMNSTDAICAASIADTPGDNIIANKLNAIKFQKLMQGSKATLNEYYADYVGVLGMESLRTQNDRESDNIILSDLQSRRESLAGVSLDEEAANMIRWQTCFTAASKMITTVDEMLQTVLNLKR